MAAYLHGMRAELVTTGRLKQKYHARLIHQNGQIIWWTEKYPKKEHAVEALTALGYPEWTEVRG